MPEVTPVTTPVVLLIVAIEILLLDHVPPVTAFESVIFAKAHTEEEPEIIPGIGLIVIDIVILQPVEAVYVMITVPAFTPVTTPDKLPILAFELLALHVPPVVKSPKVVVWPWQTLEDPVIEDGSGITVTIVVVTVEE